MFRFDGKKALVTGSTSGIGLAIASMLASCGATVLINGRSVDRVDAVVTSLREQGHDAHAAVFDIEHIEPMLAKVDELINAHGPIDILVANAAIQHREALATYPQQTFERILSANLTSQWALGRHLAQPMASQQYGRIVLIGSLAAVLGRPGLTAYTAAKAGLHGLARQWAIELAEDGITVNAVAPGYVKTPFTTALSDDEAFTAWLDSRIPIPGGWASPEDVAAAVVYLASQESRFVTGQVLAVDGGASTTIV